MGNVRAGESLACAIPGPHEDDTFCQKNHVDASTLPTWSLQAHGVYWQLYDSLCKLELELELGVGLGRGGGGGGDGGLNGYGRRHGEGREGEEEAEREVESTHEGQEAGGD